MSYCVVPKHAPARVFSSEAEARPYIEKMVPCIHSHVDLARLHADPEYCLDQLIGLAVLRGTPRMRQVAHELGILPEGP